MAHHSSVLLSSNDSATQELLEVKRKYSGMSEIESIDLSRS